MKLVEILAKEMDIWPLDAAWVGQAVDGDIHVNNSDDEFIRHTGVLLTRADDWNAAEINQAQWQAERDRQKGGEWKRHRGGRCPVHGDQQVEVKFRDGAIEKSHASDFFGWRHREIEDPDAHIMSYRVISQPQADEVPMIADGDTREYKGPFPCAPEGEPLNQLEWDIQFPSGVCSVESKTEQMETPFKWRDEVTELNAYIEKYTRERDALIERLASEGFALIAPVASVVSEFSALTIPLKDCLVGDIVEVVSLEGFASSSVQIGDKMPITSVDIHDGTVQVACGTWGDEDNYKFIRRP